MVSPCMVSAVQIGAVADLVGTFSFWPTQALLTPRPVCRRAGEPFPNCAAHNSQFGDNHCDIPLTDFTLVVTR